MLIGGGLGAVLAFLIMGAGFGGLGLGKGPGDGPGGAAGQPRQSPSSDKELTVQIEGARLVVAGEETSIDAVVTKAKNENLRVRVIRADDATRRAREELVKALVRERIPHILE